MKTIFFFFTMLISITASATVKVTPLSTDYSTNTVTFKVEWTGTPYNNHVWVWVDLCPIAGTSPGTFEKAVISAASVTSGTYSDFNGRGFFITANGTTVTATLSNASGKFNWCAYGSDYPPNVLANTNSSYTLAGTPPVKLIASDGATSLTVPGTTIATSALTFTPATITDATGYPGLWCPYTGSDLYMDATHRCLQRQSGAGNWEAWIKDTRDNELYRIVNMPDNNWWLAQNVKYAGTSTVIGVSISNCSADECGRGYTWAQIYGNYGGSYGSTGTVQGICPSNWLLPLRTTYATLTSTIGSSTEVCRSLRALNSPCSPIKNTFGFSSVVGTVNGLVDTSSIWYTNDAGREDGFSVDLNMSGHGCDVTYLANPGDTGNKGSVRCFRPL
ncbi:MAG: hypothetical protein LBU42_10555 [Prevotellaceae bacterium]|jgi:uncharacterized protein (TIGR02145 family)|nr:hypothetical protein [Prevotellaceae bacterium]